MNPTTRTRLKKLIGYPAFFSFAFGLMLYLTFPFDTVAQVARAQAKSAGVELEIGKLGPGFLGLKASRISLKMPKQPEQAKEPEPLFIDSVSVRPSLLPVGAKFSASLFGGTLEGNYGVLGSPKVKLRAKGINLLRSNAKAAVGLDLDGTLNAVVDLKVNPADHSKTEGRIALLGDGLIINGGTIAHYDLPKIDLGRLEAELKLEGGKANVTTFRANGKDVEASLEGEITLAAKATLSQLKLQLQFKPAEDFLRRNSLIQTGLSFAMSKDSKGYYGGSVSGVLGKPRFQAKR
ncbi:MAG: type II secretion system protein GspN [Myxococcales bacterium]|jgi:type II secretion system protein N